MELSITCSSTCRLTIYVPRIRSDKMLHNLDDDTFRQMLECHTVAPFRIVRAAAPYMRIKEVSKRENRSIVNVSAR